MLTFRPPISISLGSSFSSTTDLGDSNSSLLGWASKLNSCFPVPSVAKLSVLGKPLAGVTIIPTLDLGPISVSPGPPWASGRGGAAALGVTVASFGPEIQMAIPLYANKTTHTIKLARHNNHLLGASATHELPTAMNSVMTNAIASNPYSQPPFSLPALSRTSRRIASTMPAMPIASDGEISNTHTPLRRRQAA